MSIVGNKKRKINCATINVGADAWIGDDLYVDDDCTSGNLSVAGTINGSVAPPSLALPDRSASAPPLHFTSSTNSGYYWDTSDTPGQAWSAAGNKLLKLDPSHLTVSCDINNSGYDTTTGLITANEANILNNCTTGTLTVGSMTCANSLTYSSASSSSMPYFDSGKELKSQTLTNGQLMIGRTGNTPTAGTLTGTTK